MKSRYNGKNNQSGSLLKSLRGWNGLKNLPGIFEKNEAGHENKFIPQYTCYLGGAKCVRRMGLSARSMGTTIISHERSSISI